MSDRKSSHSFSNSGPNRELRVRLTRCPNRGGGLGGSGQPLVLLAGSGDTAHIYDDFAPKLTDNFHVYGITRRGYGGSSAPATGYSADRLGDDVIAVLDALHLSKPLLLGHSLAGEEISSIATRHSSRIAGAVYLDAALPFAYQNPAYPAHPSDFEALQTESSKLAPMSAPTSADVASFSAFQIWLAKMLGVRFPLSELKATLDTDAAGHITKQKTGSTITEAIHNGEERFTSIPIPALAIFAIPHAYGAAFDALPRSTREAFEAKEVTELGRMADQFQLGLPSAEVVRIAHANHYVFISNESEVLAAIQKFEADLRVKGLIQDR